MKILNALLSRFTNEEHFQFHTELKGLVENFTPVTLNIEAAWAVYESLYADESHALDVIRKSALTGNLVGADDYRDGLGRGLVYTVKGATSHFDPVKKAAATRLMVALDHYGNIGRKSYDEQTAAINSLVNDLNTGYAADVAALGIGDWVAELQSANAAFSALMQERYSEEAAKTQLTMKEARVQLDGAYRAITERIGALIIVNGERDYESFVAELNQRIERYNNMVALREGRNAGEEESGQ